MGVNVGTIKAIALAKEMNAFKKANNGQRVTLPGLQGGNNSMLFFWEHGVVDNAC